MSISVTSGAGKTPQPFWKQAWIPLLAALALLLWLAYAAWSDVFYTLGSGKVLHSVSQAPVLAPALIHAVAWFLAALLFVHLALGLTSHVLGRATCAAFRLPARHCWRASLAWLAALALWTAVANAAAFPDSVFSPAFAPVARGAHGPLLVTLAGVALAVAAAGVLAVALLRARASGTPRASTRTAVATVASVAAIGVALAIPSFSGRADATASSVDARPHVILIGIDSLRCDATRLAGGASLTPNIDRFLGAATSFSDATTPLARTFPSWMSILSGRHPVHSGARFNLIPRDHVDTRDLLGTRLRAAGYRSAYATDEVRFANIDASYGFDDTITPPIGAADFLLGELNDFPLTNLLASTRVGAWLFPVTHANRAAHVTYDPDAFVRRIDRELRVDGPTFLAVHLTLAHWPYGWAGHEKPTTPPGYRTGYDVAVRAVDAQFEDVLGVLERKGMLRNAVVVLLSDHGEALGKPGDSYVRNFADAQTIWNSIWGHGTSVLSPHQFTVMLSFRRFGGEPFATAGSVLAAPASLEDIRPTLLDVVGVPDDGAVDGLSLRAALEGGPTADLASRLRYTETDFNTDMVLKGQYEKNGLLNEGAVYYDLHPESGWVQLKPGRLPELLGRKERAVMSPAHLLAAVPHREGPGMEYLLIDRRAGFPQRLTGRPAEGEPQRLWDALHARFAGELP